MAKTLYPVTLTDEEYDKLNRIVVEGTEPETVIMRARILLLSDKTRREGKCSVLKLADQLGTTHTTIQTTKKDYTEGGVDYAIHRKKVEHRATKYDDELAEEIIAIVREIPPEGKKRWSLRMIAKECENRGIEPVLAPATIAKILRENGVEI